MSEAFEYSGAFQNRILRVLAEDPALCVSVDGQLKPQMFDGRVRQWAAASLFTHAKKYGTRPDDDALRLKLRRDLKTKRLLPELEASALAMVVKLQRPVKNRSFVRDEIWNFTQNQLYVDVVKKTLDYRDKHDFDGIKSEFRRVVDFDNLRDGRRGLRYDQTYKQRSEYRKTEIVANGISTGTKLDNYFRAGGFWPKALHVVVASYAGGKTSTMVSFARAAIVESCKKVLYVTIDEADEYAIGDRFDAAFSGVSINDLVEDEESVKAALDDLHATHGDCLRIEAFSPGTLTVAKLRGLLRQLENESFYPNLVVVDYADLMVPAVVHDKENENQGNVYMELRSMSIEEKLATLTAAQLNREGMAKETATGAQIAESIKKCHRADSIITINQTAKEKAVGRARLYVDKNRGGRARFEPIPVRVDWATQLVSDV